MSMILFVLLMLRDVCVCVVILLRFYFFIVCGLLLCCVCCVCRVAFRRRSSARVILVDCFLLVECDCYYCEMLCVFV